MTDYTPSPELVEACAAATWQESASAGVLGYDNIAPRIQALLGANANATLTAAVAYRTPEGTPELVPWVEMQDAIESPSMLTTIEACLATVAHDRAEGLFVSDQEEAVRVMRAVLRAALAPWTQENR